MENVVYNIFSCVWWRELSCRSISVFFIHTHIHGWWEREREIRRLGPSCSCPATDLNRRPAERWWRSCSSKDGRVCTEILDTIKNRISFLPCSSSSPFFSLLFVFSLVYVFLSVTMYLSTLKPFIEEEDENSLALFFFFIHVLLILSRTPTIASLHPCTLSQTHAIHCFFFFFFL